LSFKT
jgi:hypothetical protein